MESVLNIMPWLNQSDMHAARAPDVRYEVSRSLAACEGALLLVDATQGVQAQTVANGFLAMESDLNIIPVLNKIDMPAARVPEVREEVTNTFGFNDEECLECSAKTGI